MIVTLLVALLCIAICTANIPSWQVSSSTSNRKSLLFDPKLNANEPQRLPTHSLIHLFTRLLIYSLTHSLIHSLTYSFTYSLIYSLTHSLSLTHLLTYLLTPYTTYFLPLTHLLLQSRVIREFTDASSRKGFIRKVYGIFIVQMAVTISATAHTMNNFELQNFFFQHIKPLFSAAFSGIFLSSMALQWAPGLRYRSLALTYLLTRSLAHSLTHLLTHSLTQGARQFHTFRNSYTM